MFLMLQINNVTSSISNRLNKCDSKIMNCCLYWVKKIHFYMCIISLSPLYSFLFIIPVDLCGIDIRMQFLPLNIQINLNWVMKFNIGEGFKKDIVCLVELKGKQTALLWEPWKQYAQSRCGTVCHNNILSWR